MFKFRSFVFGILMVAGSSIAQDGTTVVSELESLEPATPAEEPAAPSDDIATTADVVIKGYIPDLQRSQMVKDALFDAKELERIKAEAAARAKEAKGSSAKPATNISEKANATPVAEVNKKTETAAVEATKKTEPEPTTEKARKAKEAADRANGIVAGKTSTAAAKSSGAVLKSLGSSKMPPAVALDDKPSKPAEEKKQVVVEEVPTMIGKTVPIKKVVPLDEKTDSKAVAEAPDEKPATDADGTLTVNGRLVSLMHSRNGSVKLLVDTSTHGNVEVVVYPRPGSRIPVEGSQVTVRGKRVGSSDRALVLRADSVERVGATASSSNRTGTGTSSGRVVYRHGYARRVVPIAPYGPIPGPPPMPGGIPPPYF